MSTCGPCCSPRTASRRPPREKPLYAATRDHTVEGRNTCGCHFWTFMNKIGFLLFPCCQFSKYFKTSGFGRFANKNQETATQKHHQEIPGSSKNQWFRWFPGAFSTAIGCTSISYFYRVPGGELRPHGSPPNKINLFGMSII